MAFVELLTDIIEFLLLFQSFGELSIDINLSLTASFCRSGIGLDLVSIYTLSGPKFLEIEHKALLDCSEIV